MAVDCDTDSSNSACEKPVSSLSKTVIPVCIFGFIFTTALIVFFCIMRKHKQKEAAAEEKARQKYQDLGFDDDEPRSRGPRKPQAPLRPSPNNNRQSFGPTNEGQYQANPNMYLRNEGSSFQLSQLHPSLDPNGDAKPATSKEFV